MYMYVCISIYIYIYIYMAQLTVFEIALSSLRDVIIAASCSSTAAPDTANISVQLRSGCRLSVKQASPSTRHPKSSCMYEHMNRREYTRHTQTCQTCTHVFAKHTARSSRPQPRILKKWRRKKIHIQACRRLPFMRKCMHIYPCVCGVLSVSVKPWRSCEGAFACYRMRIR